MFDVITIMVVVFFASTFIVKCINYAEAKWKELGNRDSK
jgi:hypothetical protein